MKMDRNNVQRIQSNTYYYLETNKVS